MTGLIILAAGRGGRFGQPKQNLIFQGQTLISRAVSTAIASVCRPIIVVTGAHADLMNVDVSNKEVSIIFNANWEEGMASSIRVGITAITDNPDIDSALFMLCDQPLVTPSLIAELLQKQQNADKLIVGCSYNHTIGVPMLFHRSIFKELLELTGHEGAKKILKNHPDDIAAVPFETGSLDIDTPEDYERLIKDHQS
jgi:molybdenum cofactor cytidylyltransferase